MGAHGRSGALVWRVGLGPVAVLSPGSRLAWNRGRRSVGNPTGGTGPLGRGRHARQTHEFHKSLRPKGLQSGGQETTNHKSLSHKVLQLPAAALARTATSRQG